MTSVVPTISITNPDLESNDYMASGTVTPESPTVFDVVKEMENTEPFIEDEALDLNYTTAVEKEQPETIKNFYEKKVVFITGATGFIGKAVLWKLIQSLGESVEKIIVLLRKNRMHQRSAKDRLHDDILSNKAFTSLRRSMGSNLFDEIINEKLVAMFGDLSEPQLGLAAVDMATVSSQVNVILHCAGNVDGTESVESSTKINTFGTQHLLTLADQCQSMSAFIHLSNIQQFHASGWKSTDEKHLYPLPSKSASGILDQIMQQDGIYTDYQHLYSNPYLFSKSLSEHIIVDHVIQSNENEKLSFPIAIMRLSTVGPSVQEPLIGWADGVNGINGTILLTGKGNKVIQPHIAEGVADVIPVDYVARLIIGSAATLIVSKQSIVPQVIDIPEVSTTNVPTITVAESTTITNRPSHTHKRTSSQASRISMRGSYHPRPLPGHQEQVTKTTPIIYQVSIANMRPITWKVGYEAIRHYWVKSTNINLPNSAAYFNANAQRSSMYQANGASPGLSRARTVMNSLRGFYTNAGTENAPVNTNTVTPMKSRSTERMSNGSTASTTSTSSTSSAASKRNSNRLSKTVDKAAKLAHTMKDSFYSTSSGSATAHAINENTYDLTLAIRNLDANMEFDPNMIVPEDADAKFWVNYLTNASYGIHYYVCQETQQRLPTPVYGWTCGIQASNPDIGDDDASYYQYVFGRQVNSVVYSQDQILQRTARMVAHIKGLLINNTPLVTSGGPKVKDDDWLTDLDDALDDWCQDNDITNADKEKRMALGKWRKKVGSNDESVKVIVLNDKRVNQAITQITQNAGVPKQTAVNEAMRILSRMSERTQLAFVWFTGSFLKSLFEDMFENVRILDESLRAIRQSTMGKRVVYVPVSKSMLDPLLVWFIAIRYHLPVPALACDEAMSQMGPISDVYRLAGAYYVKRDKSKRSPLNSAVTAAYTQVLLREHGALAFCLERSRSRTGKFQEAYPDGFVEMVLESTLQTNQTARSNTSSVIQRVVSSDVNTPPASPDSPTMSVDSSHFSVSSQQQQQQQPRKVHKDVVFVPINITYENVPELSRLIDEVLDQQPTRPAAGRTRSASSSALPTAPTPGRSNMIRPSEAKDRRKTLLDGLEAPKKRGRVTFGVGPLISVQEAAEAFHRKSAPGIDTESYESQLVDDIIQRIHESQCKGLVVSPVSIVASIVLYGRATHGVCIGKIKELMEWLRYDMVHHGYKVDWQEGEDLDSLILSAFKLLDEPKNLILDGRDINDDTNVRVNDHADNVMALSYYANQMIDIFLLDSFFAIVYLSFVEESVLEDEFMDRFRFLLQLLEREFVLDWDLEAKFEHIVQSFMRKEIVRKRDNRLLLLVNMENDPMRYEQLIFLASLVYPTVDAYWITSCSLSALEAVPMLPRCVVPLLTQWIATHLITGRRTIYREVLSTESSKTAVDVFMSMGFLTEIHAKEKLSPDAQILLHELGIPTSEILIELAGQNSDGGKTPVTPTDPEGMMKAVMAQIQMNRANSNMADLCQQIDSYRLGAASQRESFQNAQVFQKCLKQIKGILQANTSFAKRKNLVLPEDEDGLVQLVYSLLASSVPAGDRAAQERALRRISEAYNLR